jgi:hypothetical protein
MMKLQSFISPVLAALALRNVVLMVRQAHQDKPKYCLYHSRFGEDEL